MSAIEVSTITQTIGFRVPVSVLYEALTDAKLVSGYTQTPCTIDAKVGGEFSLFGGSITGKFEKLSPNEIIETWRFKEWQDGHYSRVVIKLEAVDSSSTKLTLTQSNIPHVDKFDNHSVVEKVEAGWHNFFWLRIQKVLGYPRLEL